MQPAPEAQAQAESNLLGLVPIGSGVRAHADSTKARG